MDSWTPPSSLPAKCPRPNITDPTGTADPLAGAGALANVSSCSSQSKTNFLSLIFLIFRLFLSTPKYRERMALKSVSVIGGTYGVLKSFGGGGVISPGVGGGGSEPSGGCGRGL